MSRAAANKKNSSKTKSTNPEVYFEAFFSPRASTGSHLKFHHFFLAHCVCANAQMWKLSLSVPVWRKSYYLLFLCYCLPESDTSGLKSSAGSDNPLLRLKQMPPSDCSFVPACLQNGSFFSFTLQRFYRCVAECIEIFYQASHTLFYSLRKENCSPYSLPKYKNRTIVNRGCFLCVWITRCRCCVQQMHR